MLKEFGIHTTWDAIERIVASHDTTRTRIETRTERWIVNFIQSLIVEVNGIAVSSAIAHVCNKVFRCCNNVLRFESTDECGSEET